MRKSLVGMALLGILALTATAALAADPVPDTDHTFRLAGADRWETAAEISVEYWEPEFVHTVFLASGDVFPDALAIGPSMFFRGPLLLVHGPDATFPDGDLSDPTREELERLAPCEIVAAGGPVRITDEVLQEADEFVAPDDDPKCTDEEPPGPEQLQRMLQKMNS